MYVDVDGAQLFFDTVGAQLAIEDDRMQERGTLIVMRGGPGLAAAGSAVAIAGVMAASGVTLGAVLAAAPSPPPAS